MRTVLSAVIAAGAALCVALPTFAQVAGFSDVPKDHWAADSVGKLATAGIIQGSSVLPLGAGKQVAQAKPSPKAAYDGNKPVTRYELAVTLWRFVQYIEQANGQKKGKLHVMAAPADGPTAVKKLIAGGYLPKNSPLASDGEKIVTGNQLADALAQVIERNREKITPQTPGSLKSSPIEKPEGAGRG